MNEITRIHIAKTPYDIEVSAKKELEQYINKLERYAEDGDWLEDIEIRMTELLAERGIEKNGVIASDDVQAIREQLGDPQEFLGEGDIAVGADIEQNESRRLYRDLEGAVLGGVLSGIAKFFGINPLWTRLAFIILLFISFGTAAVVYLVLWLVIPPARTAAEQLQLAGKPVTLASIKELRLQGDEVNRLAKLIQNVLIYGMGVLASIGAIISIIVTIWGGTGLLLGVAGPPFGGIMPDTGVVWLAYILFVASGLLLTTLFSLVAYAFFRKKLTKRVGVLMVAVTLAGIAAFGSGVASLYYQHWQTNNQAAESRFTRNVTLPKQFAEVSNLILDTGEENTGRNGSTGIYVEYIVASGAPRYELQLDSRTEKVTPATTFSQDGKTVTLTVTELNVGNSLYSSQAHLKVYGPVLENVTVRKGAMAYTNKAGQDTLVAVAEAGVIEAKGSYKNLMVTTGENSLLTASSASVENLTATVKGGYVDAGVVRTLTVTQSDVCAAEAYYDDQENRLVVQAVTSGKLTFNGDERRAETMTHPCGEVIVGDEEDYEEGRQD